LKFGANKDNKKNFELVMARTQLKIEANEKKVSHIAFESKKGVGITQTKTLKGSCSSNMMRTMITF